MARLDVITTAELLSRVLFRDAHVLILDKPAGLAVHRAPGAGGLTLESFLPDLSFGLKWPPGLAHRLDRDTSGCLVLGRHPAALRRLNQLFAERAVAKTYWAVVEGGPDDAEGLVDLPLLKVHRGNQWRIVPDAAGQSALTRWRVLGRGAGATWLELSPETGRTHQIRAHCAALGWPVLGDPLYGARPALGQRLHLHARAVSLTPNPKRDPVAAEAPPPPHMLIALRAGGFVAEAGIPEAV
jgi:RluA family pseudouridine synthase